MARLADIVIDCRDPASLARFWAGVLDDYTIAPYDDAELARLASMGIDNPEDDPTVLLLPLVDLSGKPRIFLQRVPEATGPESNNTADNTGKKIKNKVHLDVAVDGRVRARSELVRLVDLGATVLAERPDWVTLADPEGNEFCLTW